MAKLDTKQNFSIPTSQSERDKILLLAVKALSESQGGNVTLNQILSYADDIYNNLTSRIDNLAKVPSGGTTGDLELQDIRLGADGVSYPNAGTAVRTQFANEKTTRETAITELKGDLDYLIKKDTINHIDKTNATYFGWDVFLPIYLEKDVRYIIGWAFTNDDSLVSPGVALKIVNNATDRNVLQSIKTDYTQISSNGHPFTWTNDTGWYYIQICPTSQGTENTYKYVMCVKNAYLINNKVSWIAIKYSNYKIFNTSYSDYATLSDKVKSRWYKKVHLSYGDSITDQAVWQDYFQLYLGTAREIIKGYSGHALWTHCTLNAITSQLGSETFDFATVMFGTNDWGQSRQIGVNTDFNDNGDYTGTYKGSLNSFCKNITTLFPNKPIIMVTPPNGFEDYDYNGEAFTDNGSKNLLGFTIKDYAEAMKEICALWGIPCFDFNSVCGWNYINKATYLTDDGNGTFIHPNSVGGKEYAYKLAKFCEMN